MEVCGLHIEKFLDAGASIVEQRQKEVVPWTLASGAINLAEEVVQLLGAQVAQHWTYGLFHANHQNPLARRRERGFTLKHVAKETVDGRKTRVAGMDAVLTRGLQTVEERKNDIGAEILDCERIDLPLM